MEELLSKPRPAKGRHNQLSQGKKRGPYRPRQREHITTEYLHRHCGGPPPDYTCTWSAVEWFGRLFFGLTKERPQKLDFQPGFRESRRKGQSQNHPWRMSQSV